MIIINYYISDLHFGCENKHEGRTLEHDQIIINNWNHTVTNADKVFILGDIGKIGNNEDNEYLCKCISVLKGQKICILGNHDKGLKDIRLRQLFTEVCDYKEIMDNYNGLSHKLVLCHYPILMWNGQHKNWLHLYGHVHMSNEWGFYENSVKQLNSYFKDKTLKGRSDCPPAFAYNVGAALLGWTPRTLKEVIEINQAVSII